MRCDIQQLTGKGTVNDPSLTTLAMEEATRSHLSSPHRVRYYEPDVRRSAQTQYAQLRLLRSAPTSGNRMFTQSFRRDRQMSRDSGDRRFYGWNNPQPIMTRPTPNKDILFPKCGYRKHDHALPHPAVGKQCWACFRMGHLKSVCRSVGSTNE